MRFFGFPLVGKFVMAGLLFGVAALQAGLAPLADDPAATAGDREFMTRAYQLADQAVKDGNTPFGAVLVVDGKIVAEFANAATTSHDPTKHAEAGLISAFMPKLDHAEVRRSVLYASGEPCVMCAGAILNSGIPKVVYGVSTSQVHLIIEDAPEKNPLTFREIVARTNPTVEVVGPLMEKEGLPAHEAYWPEAMKKWKQKN